MKEETWDIELGDRTFTVPRMPLKYSRKTYPLCQKLSNTGFADRITGTFKDGIYTPPPPLQVTDEEMDQLTAIALFAAQSADTTLTEEAFGDMPITPPQLFDAFFAARKACGGWRPLFVEDKKSEDVESDLNKPPISTLIG